MRGITLLFVAVVGTALLFGCGGGDENGNDLTGHPDAADAVAGDSVRPDGLGPDALPRQDVIGVDGERKTVMRKFQFRAMGGISMGACGLTFHARHPGHLDLVAALGGYLNYHYLHQALYTHMFGGFCDMETILEHVDDLNNPDIPELKCGPVPPDNKWEQAGDFNHWVFDDSGGEWDRDGYWHPLEGIFTGFGNFLYHNPDHPYLPPGVPLAWAEPGNDKDKCANPVHVQKPYNYNAEYNPDGEYDLITFCDGEEPVPGGKDNPDYWELKGAYDPTYEHDRPVHIVLAVDYNGNGKRDFHEPVVMNPYERFDDVGSDGCADGAEDGAGGCGGGGAGDDPNHDNYDIEDHPFGTEGDGIWQDGEPYADSGVDGVEGTGDYGEGDGQYTWNATLEGLMKTSALPWIDTAPQEEIDSVDIILDAGIRDSMASLAGMFPFATHLQAREPDTRIYDGYTEFETSLYPANTTVMLLIVAAQMDWTAAGIGKNFIVRYGDPEATEEQKSKGDGKHLGTDIDIFNRLAILLLTPLYRWPDPDVEPCPTEAGQTMNRTFYSQALQNRYQYSISLPPGYNGEGRESTTYPVIFYLPGHGITASDAIAAGVAFNILMQSGDLPKFMLAVPEGQCCRINVETGDRYCACDKKDGVWNCVDPDCKGPHEECEVLQIPSNTLEQECNGGHFFANQVSNKFGNVEMAEFMRFEDMLLDLIEEIDANFRTTPPAEYEVTW